MRRKQQNSGFSLIELIIALAVLAFLMLAVSSFMGSSVMQSKKERADVKMQTQSQEVYNLITDSIMQANDILIVGYTASDDDDIDFAKPGETTTATLTKKYYVRDKKTAEALMKDPATYGISGSVSASDIVYFTDLSATTNIYISYMRHVTRFFQCPDQPRHALSHQWFASGHLHLADPQFIKNPA